MKEQLKRLYLSNFRHYEVWNFLWLMSENGEYIFTYLDLCYRFRVPKSTLTRILQLDRTWNTDENRLTEIEKIGKAYRVKFLKELQEPVKTKKKSIHPERTEKIYEFLVTWYDEKNIEYPTLSKDKAKITKVLKKIEELLKKQGQSISDDNVIKMTISFWNRIPAWYIKHQITINAIDRNFYKIYNQIKSTTNEQPKQSRAESFGKASADSTIDYSQFTT